MPLLCAKSNFRVASFKLYLGLSSFATYQCAEVRTGSTALRGPLHCARKRIAFLSENGSWGGWWLSEALEIGVTALQPTSWAMDIKKHDLIAAIKHARTRATLRRKGSGFEPDVLFMACDGGVSIRSSNASMDIPASGVWVSPVMANGAALRRLAPKLTGPHIEISYGGGRMILNGTSIPAREA